MDPLVLTAGLVGLYGLNEAMYQTVRQTGGCDGEIEENVREQRWIRTAGQTLAARRDIIEGIYQVPNYNWIGGPKYHVRFIDGSELQIYGNQIRDYLEAVR